MCIIFYKLIFIFQLVVFVYESGLRTIKYRANKKPPKGGFFVPVICLPLLL